VEDACEETQGMLCLFSTVTHTFYPTSLSVHGCTISDDCSEIKIKLDKKNFSKEKTTEEEINN
jgi:hypothetical protein